MHRSWILLALFVCHAGGLLADTVEDGPQWGGTAGVGWRQDWGNTEASDVSVNLRGQRDYFLEETLHSQYALDAGLQYRTKHSEVANDQAFIAGSYRRYLSEVWSWRVIQRFRYDHVKNLDFGSNSSIGVGYILLTTETQELLVDLGLGYAVDCFSSSNDSDSYVSSNAYVSYSLLVNDWLTLKSFLEWIQSLQMSKQFELSHSASLQASFDEHWGVEQALITEYDNQPAEGKKAWDVVLQLSLTYSL